MFALNKKTVATSVEEKYCLFLFCKPVSNLIFQLLAYPEIFALFMIFKFYNLYFWELPSKSFFDLEEMPTMFFNAVHAAYAWCCRAKKNWNLVLPCF